MRSSSPWRNRGYILTSDPGDLDASLTRTRRQRGEGLISISAPEAPGHAIGSGRHVADPSFSSVRPSRGSAPPDRLPTPPGPRERGLGARPEILAGGVHASSADPEGSLLGGPGGGEIGRIALLLTTYEWSDWRNGTILIQSVYVLPEERGCGVYWSLYENLKRTVERLPRARRDPAYVDRRNAAAQRTYERLGMTREHTPAYDG